MQSTSVLIAGGRCRVLVLYLLRSNCPCAAAAPASTPCGIHSVQPMRAGTQVQLQLAALKRRAAARAAKRAASQASAAASCQPQHSAVADQAHNGLPEQKQEDRFSRSPAWSEDARMGAREAAASVAFAYEQRQPRSEGSHVQHADGSDAPRRRAGSRAVPSEGKGTGAELGGVAEEQCRPQPEQPGRHAADGETASRRPVPSGHLSAQLAGLRRKSVLRAQLEVSEV